MEKKKMEKKKSNLSLWIIISMVLGIIAGLLMTSTPEIATKYIQPFGTIFLNLIKFIVVPIVFFTIITGVTSMSDIKKVGSIGLKTILFYFSTTAVALVISLVVANLFKGMFSVLETSDLVYEASSSTSLMDTFVNVFPSNIVTPFANAAMLQVIVASLLFGLGIIKAGPKGKSFADFINGGAEVSLAIMESIIKLSPFAVFCLITPVVAINGVQILGNLGMVLLCAYTGYMIHVVLVYAPIVKIFGGLSPMTFFREMVAPMAFAFSSASSVATLPINMETCEKLGAKREITSFVLPLGATINMDGTAIYQGVCSVFIAVCFGIDLTLPQMGVIVLTATLASIGTAGVPGAGVVMLAMVLESVGLPVEGIALVIGIDRLFDMGRTAINITGDAACTIVISNSERKKEEKLVKSN